LGKAMSAPTLVADAVTTWLEKGEQRPTLCFAVDRAHARKLCESFTGAGVPAEYMDAYTSREERARIGQRLRTGATKVACNVGVATTGVDWPWVSCLVLCRPTKSEALYIQIIGRVLRLHPQGGDSIILDHTDTALRLGLPTEIHHDTLDDGKPAKAGKKKAKDDKKPLPKACTSCGVLKPAGVHKCPACGFAPMRQSDLDFADGQLHELARSACTSRSGPSQADMQLFYAMLVHEATARGHSDKWVWGSFRSRWGQYPDRCGINPDCRPIAPDETVCGWLVSRQIAWAKSKSKRAA
jgi:superfamily II DNA or RNA helicase